MIDKIVSNFNIGGSFIDAQPFGNGHINDTFLITFEQNGVKKKYILRKINKYVFKDPKIVVDNTVNVIEHISKKMKDENVKEISNKVMQLIETKDSKFYYLDKNNDYWCSVFFIQNAYTVETVRTKEQAYQAAKAFGHFQKYLIDADVNNYKDSIPNFHNLESRLISYNKAIEENPVGRAELIEEELKLANKYKVLSKKITKLISSGKLPIRITHNDTKINNVMLNKETHIGECVIDLDTIMPGTVLYDFGDMVRTSTSPVEEDEKDSSKVFMRIEIFDSLVKGYLEELSEVLQNVEIENLIYGAKVIVYEQAIRFLTDYILNDIYYNTAYAEHNLVRARTQFALLESIENQTDEMEKIVEKYSYK